MLGKRISAYRPSLRRWAGVFAMLWTIGAAVMAPVSISLLDQISDDAHLTYNTEIPFLLDRNRNAVKLERLSSFLQRLASTSDPQVERRVFLQLQTLAQGFDLDDDARLNGGAADAVASARRIVALHVAARRLAAPSRTTGRSEGAISADPSAGAAETEKAASHIVDEAVQKLDTLTDYLSTDAALMADGMANRIQHNASRVKQGCLAALAFFVAFGVLLLWIFQRHVLNPIAVLVRGLESITASAEGPIAVPRARFFELDLIGRSVEQHARFADDLRTANSALYTLSKRDDLTGLSNRRSFDADLSDACRRAAAAEGCFALLLIDIDHFKLLNDRFGHLVGDQCLQQVAITLQSFSSRRGDHASRYGGEEFAMILWDVSQDDAKDLAEQLRAAVARTQVYLSGARRALELTVSVGVAPIPRGSADTPDGVISAADEALYRAKRDGRNTVCVSERNAWEPSGSQCAA